MQYVLGGRGISVVLESIYCRSFSLCILPDSETTQFLEAPQDKNLGGERAPNR
jgi:hypothetical protein